MGDRGKTPRQKEQEKTNKQRLKAKKNEETEGSERHAKIEKRKRKETKNTERERTTKPERIRYSSIHISVVSVFPSLLHSISFPCDFPPVPSLLSLQRATSLRSFPSFSSHLILSHIQIGNDWSALIAKSIVCEDGAKSGLPAVRLANEHDLIARENEETTTIKDKDDQDNYDKENREDREKGGSYIICL